MKRYITISFLFTCMFVGIAGAQDSAFEQAEIMTQCDKFDIQEENFIEQADEKFESENGLPGYDKNLMLRAIKWTEILDKTNRDIEHIYELNSLSRSQKDSLKEVLERKRTIAELKVEELKDAGYVHKVYCEKYYWLIATSSLVAAGVGVALYLYRNELKNLYHSVKTI